MPQSLTVAWDADRVRIALAAPRIDVRLVGELDATLDAAEDAGVQRIVLRLRCEGMSFAGFDPDGAPDIHGFHKWEKLVTRLERARALTVAVVDGPCHGPGFQLLLACDVRVATPAARLSLPEVQQGYLPGMATWRLARYVGLGRAKRLVLSGEVLDAEAASALGLLDAVVPDAEAAEAAGHALLGDATPVAGALARRLLNESFETATEDAVGHFLAAQARAIAQPAFTRTLAAHRRTTP